MPHPVFVQLANKGRFTKKMLTANSYTEKDTIISVQRIMQYNNTFWEELIVCFPFTTI
jgi:hypothetical protein